ncbi:BLOC-2 complex member HPS5 homolog [Onthophagus taurus]|uniref:BLOC-2 complex member HPS5 homolog n=1 Tax=Onthophagus taurus TaxID=166361 RepID=UPI0039BDB285
MNKKHLFVEYLSNVNTVIKQPLQQTQRIKFTSLDVSQNYIVFGATSGGIYIFNRYPSKFIKLLPNKEGSITNISVSLDECAVAITTVKGLIVIIQNCFLDNGLKYQIYKEHEGKNITAIKWQVNELYVGDDFGKITVISLPSKTSKSLFNIPSATLMTLDSSVVQLDTFSNYLLASTRTKTYLCDTDKEQYRQIGKKPRDGHYGAIFHLNKNSFNQDDVKIYCARPGCRIWEAKFDGSVTCTHQFKESLNNNTSSIIHVNNKENLMLNVSKSKSNPTGFNFGKIFVISNLILSFQEDSIYIFDINTVKLLFWTNYFNGIKDVKILDNSLYIWCGKHYLRTLYLTDIEDFVHITLSKRQYRLCSEFCSNHTSDILRLISDGKLDKLKVLKEKVVDDSLLDGLKEILSNLRDDKINHTSQKLKNGIYVVNSKPQDELKSNYAVIISENDEKKVNGEDKSSIEILYSQYQINKINNSVDTPKYLSLIYDLNNFIKLYEPFINYMVLEKNENEFELKHWFFNSTLKYMSNNYTTKVFENLQHKDVLEFVKNAFIEINKSEDKHSCSCSYPLPTAKSSQCHYFNVGCEILNNYSDNLSKQKEILTNVPYMFKYLLSKSEEFNLSLIIQYGDIQILLNFLKEFTYDTWDEACKLFIKLKSNLCLNCDSKIPDFNRTDLNWTHLGRIMLKSLNATSTINLLTRYSLQIESGELNENFYQTCILTSCLQSNGSILKDKTEKLIEKIKEDKIGDIVGTFLSKKNLGGFMSNGLGSSQYCTICDVPKMPILDEFIRLKCGHWCHKICCLDMNKCKRCDQL